MVRRLAEPTTPVSPKVNERKNAAALTMNRSFETGTFTTLDARTRRVRRRLGIAILVGFFPGMIVYLTHWFRLRDRSRAIAGLYAAVPTSTLIGSPIANEAAVVGHP